MCWDAENYSSIDDLGDAVCVDSEGNALITGTFGRTGRFGPFTLTSLGGQSAFVAKVSPSGQFLWATNATGTGAGVIGDGISCGAYDDVLVSGTVRGTAYFGPSQLASRAGSDDPFVAALDRQGRFLSAARGGGDSTDYGYGVRVAADGNAIAVGNTTGPSDFQPHNLPGEWSGGGWVARQFVAKYRCFTGPEISDFAIHAGTATVSCVNTRPDAPLVLEQSSQLLSRTWNPVTNWTPGSTASVIRIRDGGGVNPAFYRIRLQ